MTQIKILVVDNHPGVREQLVANLEATGYEVFQAASPEEARQRLEEELIHLAIVDIRLRNDDDENDTSGLDLCREMDPTVARVILTAFPRWDLVRDAMKPTDRRHRSADGFLVKTGDSALERMLVEIQQVLQEEFEIIPERRIAVLTSGADSPGMNAAIWAIVRIAMDNDIEVIGFQDGYQGLVKDWMRKLTWSNVSDILVQGGTILGTARFPEFKDSTMRQKAVDNIVRKQISGLIVIGGDGSMKGAHALANDLAAQGKTLQTVAIPGTIDNDLWGTDMSLGADSAANAMIQELRNMIRPAQALRRIFVCEAMGHYCGYLALQAALGIGADAVIIPEKAIEVWPDPTNSVPLKDRLRLAETKENFLGQLEDIETLLEGAFASDKRYGFVLVGEGTGLLTREWKEPLDGKYVQEYLEDKIKGWSHPNRPDVRTQPLSYPVRGCPPCRFDVWLGARLGAAAVQCLLDGKKNVMVGWSEERGIIETPFDEVVEKSNRPPQEIWKDRPKWQELLELQKALACPPGLREQLREQENRFVW